METRSWYCCPCAVEAGGGLDQSGVTEDGEKWRNGARILEAEPTAVGSEA